MFLTLNDDIMIELILEKYYENKNQDQIVKELKISKPLVSRYLKNHFGKIPTGYEKAVIIYKDDFEKALKIYLEEEKCSLLELNRRFDNLKLSQIKRYFASKNIRIKDQSDLYGFVKYDDLWSPVKDELGAYLLGFFLADGHLEILKETQKIIKISVNIQDSHILKLYKKAVNAPDYKIYVRGNQSYLNIRSDKMAQALLDWGIDNLKTYTLHTLPKIKDSLVHHMIRGYFDGDGSAIIRKRSANGYLSGYNRQFNIASGNLLILKDICKLLPINTCNIITNPPIQRMVKGHLANFKESYTLDIRDTQTIKDIYEFLYKDSNYFFKRKKDKLYLCTLSNNKIDEALQGNL